MSGQIMSLVNEGNQQSTHIERAIEKAIRQDADLHALAIIDAWRFGGYSVYGWDVLVREEHEKRAEATLNEIRKRVEDEDIEFKPEVTVGKPCETIIEYVDQRDIDLVVSSSPRGDGKKLRSPWLIEELKDRLPADIEVI